jgi:hypothetical protein
MAGPSSEKNFKPFFEGIERSERPILLLFKSFIFII